MPTLLAMPTVRLPLVTLALLSVVTVAPGQNYKSDEVVGSLSRSGTLAKRFAKGGSGDEALFKQYIEQYFFPSMTRSGAEGLADLEGAQDNLFRYFLYDAAPANRAYVNDKATEFALRVVGDRKYHPSVRYNAMLILGRLRDDYAEKTPSAKANAELCKWATLGATNEKAYGYELAGALIGLEQHTRTGKLGRNEARASMSALFKVLKTEKLPMPLDSDVSDWLYLTAAKGIANFGQPGPKGGLFASLLSRKVADESVGLGTRAAIAAELERMKLAPGKVKAGLVVAAVTDLAKAVAKYEGDTAEKFEDVQIGPGRFVADSRGMLSRRIREGGADNEGQPVYVREGLLEVLSDLRTAVRAAKGVAEGEDQQKLTTVEQAVSETVSVVASKDKGDLTVAGAVRSMARQIENVFPAEEAAEEDPADLAATP